MGLETKGGIRQRDGDTRTMKGIKECPGLQGIVERKDV